MPDALPHPIRVEARPVPRVRRGRLDAVAAALVVLLLVCAWLPWTTSGAVQRNGWATATSALRLDAVEGVPRLLTVLWLATPVLLAVAVSAIVLQRRRVAGAVVVVAGAVAVVAAMGVRFGPLPITVLPWVALALGCALVACGSRMLGR